MTHLAAFPTFSSTEKVQGIAHYSHLSESQKKDFSYHVVIILPSSNYAKDQLFKLEKNLLKDHVFHF